MTETTQDTRKQNTALQLIVVAVLLVAVFFGAYRFASARGEHGEAPAASAAQASASGAGAGLAAGNGGAASGSAGGSGCACCGGSSAPTANGVTGTPVEGTAQVSGGVQAIAVKVGTTYSPNIIKLRAGVPAEITFGQGGGCTAQVISQDLGFSEDLSAGPKVVSLPALKKGTYSFSCGMGMVFGSIVVE